MEKFNLIKINPNLTCSSHWLQVVGLNFSSATTPELLLKTFDHYCEYRRTPNGVVLSPVQLNKWLVLFCDEINLPNMDKYGRWLVWFSMVVCLFIIFIMMLILFCREISAAGIVVKKNYCKKCTKI